METTRKALSFLRGDPTDKAQVRGPDGRYTAGDAGPYEHHLAGFSQASADKLRGKIADLRNKLPEHEHDAAVRDLVDRTRRQAESAARARQAAAATRGGSAPAPASRTTAPTAPAAPPVRVTAVAPALEPGTPSAANAASARAKSLTDAARASGSKADHERAAQAQRAARDAHYAAARTDLNRQSWHEQMGDTHGEQADVHDRAARGEAPAPRPRPAPEPARAPVPRTATDATHNIRMERDEYGATHVKDATTGEHLGTVTTGYKDGVTMQHTFEPAYGTRRELTDAARAAVVAHHAESRRARGLLT